MHPNTSFRQASDQQNLDFARRRGFGILSVNGENGPLMAHVPFLLSDDGKLVEFHLVRSNPVARALPGPAVLAVSGADTYVSPDWYEVPDQVPTWNYVAVHLRGIAELAGQDTMPDLLARQSAEFENRLLPKVPWTMDKMSDGVAERMMRAIVPCRMAVETVDGTWKLSQNKPRDVRQRVIETLGGMDADPHALGIAQLMRDAEQN